MTKEELDKIISKMTPSERSEFFALVAAEKKEPTFKDALFERQTAFLEDPARMKVVLCTRRSGKSYGAGLLLFKEAYSQANVSCLYVALTRASAKRIMWKDVFKTIDREQGLGCRFNETELSVTLPNGSMIYLLGMDADEQEKDKALGQKFKSVVIDEAASYGVDLHEMVYGILKPATADYRGTIAMIGTPGNMKRGLFYELTKGQVPGEPGRWEKMGWSGHRWTAFDNPHMTDKWKAEIEDLKLANPLIEETPLFQQHYLGKWTVDDSKLVYRFDYERNTFDELPVMKAGGRWHYNLGIDLGFNDPTAWVVTAYHDFDRTLYVLGAHKKEKCDITEVADQTRKLMGRFEFDRIIIDNANKQAIVEMQRRHDIPLTAAEKAGKADFIEIMNGDFIQGHIKLHRKGCVPLMDEYGQLIWDERSIRREEHAAAPNHCCFVDGTLITTLRGDVPIETVTSNDWVLTRNGWNPVEWCASTGQKPVLRVNFTNGSHLIGTEEHPVWTESGWKRLDDLTSTDVFVTSVKPCENNTSEARRKRSSGTARFGAAGRTQSAEAIVSISRTTQPGFIARLGSFITAPFRMDSIFITATATPAITTFPTLNACLPAITNASITQPPPQRPRPSGWLDSNALAMPLPLGMHRQKAAHGIASMLKRLQQSVLLLWFNAKSAVLRSAPSVQRAAFAVERVTPAGTARVWALKVSRQPEYFANGVLVHNCDAMLYNWRHCYSYLADLRQPNGLRHGHSEEDWMLLQAEQELERALEERRTQEAELALYDATLQ